MVMRAVAYCGPGQKAVGMVEQAGACVRSAT